jgi:hypothetical protein
MASPIANDVRRKLLRPVIHATCPQIVPRFWRQVEASTIEGFLHMLPQNGTNAITGSEPGKNEFISVLRQGFPQNRQCLTNFRNQRN